MKTSEIIERINQLISELDCDDLVDLHNYLFPSQPIKVEDITKSVDA